MARYSLPLVLSCLALAPGAAQTPLTGGVSAGAVQLTDHRSERALTGVVQYQAARWLLLSANPAYLAVTDDSGGTARSASGPGDLPVSAAAFHVFSSPASPVVAAALTVVLPLGNAACGLGLGATALGLDVGAGVSPTGRLHLSADASRSASGVSAQSALNAPRATSLRAEAGYDVAPRWRGTVSLGVDVGPADSTQALSRLVGVGATHAIAGPLALTLDGSVGLTATSPRWALAVGLGTAFAGVSPVSLSSSLRRLRTAFGGGVSRGSVGGKAGCP